jgi:hypothetical protein
MRNHCFSGSAEGDKPREIPGDFPTKTGHHCLLWQPFFSRVPLANLAAVQTMATTLENFSLKKITKQTDEMQDFYCENR